MKSEEFFEEHKLELENRIKNLVWTISGDYTLELKPDTESFLHTPNAALYEGIKQGGLAKYFDKDQLSLYLIKKIYCHAMEAPLMSLAQVCIDEAVGRKLDGEREGVRSIRRKAYEELMEEEFHTLSANQLGMFQFAYFRECLEGNYTGTKKQQECLEMLHTLQSAKETMDIIKVVDALYNILVDTGFERKNGTLEDILAVSIEDLQEFSWQDFLDETALEDSLQNYLDQVSEAMTKLDVKEISGDLNLDAEGTGTAPQTLVVDPKALEKMYSYVERNFGQTYLRDTESKRLNYLMCRGIHSQCTLFYTEGVLKNPVVHNYQFEYARKQRDKNRMSYYDKHRVVKHNIRVLTDTLKRAFVLRDQEEQIRSDRGDIIPSQLWKIGRSDDARLFQQTIRNDAIDFVVDVLIDASGSQRKRQDQVVLQAYIIAEALSNLGIPFRVISFCTFWDYTVLHRFRDYDDNRIANSNIFDFMTSSNNRDGLAIKAAGSELLTRDEAHKVMIILSDGKPLDVVVQRQNSRTPDAYQGQVAINDTGMEVRRLRQQGVAVLGVFVGDEKELGAERRIFGKDFAYIRTMKSFSNIVGRYLLKQIEE